VLVCLCITRHGGGSRREHLRPLPGLSAPANRWSGYTSIHASAPGHDIVCPRTISLEEEEEEEGLFKLVFRAKRWGKVCQGSFTGRGGRGGQVQKLHWFVGEAPGPRCEREKRRPFHLFFDAGKFHK
jgi:hypothetical protein